ncbi:hypothetical protein [Micromonospora sp. NPDC047740]|uniref:hypothetical protein n=1 Tax=Micromonospora sp. NPDC047740 TaxID=3364254 RepID=UPI0037184892
MIMVCGPHTWAIEAETAIYTLNLQGSASPPRQIPAQRDGDHAKLEEPSRFV